MKRSTEQGMITFDQALFELFQANEISYEDALKYADSANEVRLRVKLRDGDQQRGEMARAIEKISLVDGEADEDPRF